MLWALKTHGTLSLRGDQKGWDVRVPEGGEIYIDQVKTRKDDERQFHGFDLSVGAEYRVFDRLVVMFIRKLFDIRYALQIPYAVVRKEAERTGRMRDIEVYPTTWKNKPGVVDVAKSLRQLVMDIRAGR